MKIFKTINPQNKKLLSRYLVISLISYGFVFSGLMILVDFLQMNKTIAFILMYGLNYVFLYSVQLKYLFKTEHHNSKLLKFIGSVALFYVLANTVYNAGLALNINYLLSTFFTIALLMPLRFLILKYFVYKG